MSGTMSNSIPSFISVTRQRVSAAITCAAVAMSIGAPLPLWAQSDSQIPQSAISTPRSSSTAGNTPDSATITQPVRRTPLFHNSGFYVSLGGGTSLPSLELNDRGYQPGFNIHVPIGYHRPQQLLGVRLDLGYNRLGSDKSVIVHDASGQGFAIPANRPQIYSATLNMTARGQLGAFGIYGLGGAGVYQFRSFGSNSPIGQVLGEPETPTEAIEYGNGNKIRRNAFGAQIGGGVEFGIGAAALFVESRFVNVFGNTDDFFNRQEGLGSHNAIRWVPVAVGITLR